MATDPTNPPVLSSFSLHVKITVAPENVDAFLAALKPAYDGVIAEKENVFFEVYHNPQKKGEFKFIENWNASVKWFMTVQLNKEYYKPYLAATEPMWIKPREVEIWERMEGGKWVSIKEQ